MARVTYTVKKAQSILEYTIILSAVILGILAMSGKMKEMVGKGLSDTADTFNNATETYKSRMLVDAPPVSMNTTFPQQK